ncbi:hypothetical protein N431DRAFT_127525 [Stipitochalara longipes BDJ]|nr:hypothetical protein N431DRAFT_127525 [Stipitochalara longipes BDJ]
MSHCRLVPVVGKRPLQGGVKIAARIDRKGSFFIDRFEQRSKFSSSAASNRQRHIELGLTDIACLQGRLEGQPLVTCGMLIAGRGQASQTDSWPLHVSPFLTTMPQTFSSSSSSSSSSRNATAEFSMLLDAYLISCLGPLCHQPRTGSIPTDGCTLHNMHHGEWNRISLDKCWEQAGATMQSHTSMTTASPLGVGKREANSSR